METIETIDTEEFTIDSADRVEWYLRKLANIAAERERVKAQAAAILARLDTDEEGLKFRFENQVIAWTRNQVEGSRRKSVQTLQGTVGFRKVPSRVVIDDTGKALSFAADSGFAVQTTLNTAEYRKEAQKRLQETGEVLPGCAVAPEYESFSISFGK